MRLRAANHRPLCVSPWRPQDTGRNIAKMWSKIQNTRLEPGWIQGPSGVSEPGHGGGRLSC